ncbi:MAG: hypothetical protein R2744_11625 [Bacteroidales bacterium]
MDKPIAVRSSSLFEDSIGPAILGYLRDLPYSNNHPDFDVRHRHVSEAIKLVYASIYSKSARTYFEAINYKVEQRRWQWYSRKLWETGLRILSTRTSAEQPSLITSILYRT